MTARSLRLWSAVHKWTSLVCTAFMLLLCVTGLPLIFTHQIGHLLGTEVEAPAMPAETPYAPLDDVVAAARAQHPTLVPQFMFREPDERNLWMLSFGKTTTSPTDIQYVAVDARTTAILQKPSFNEGFMYYMLQVHTDLFAGVPGALFLGLMGLLLVIAIVSGVVLYAPFMRKLDFGTVRRDQSSRLKWLDLHNLLGAVTIGWLLVVGVTGIINTLTQPMIKIWQANEVAQMIAPYKGQAPVLQPVSLDAAMRAAVAREPDMLVSFVGFPGATLSTPHHYAVFMRGTEPLTARLVKPVLIDALTAEVTDSRELPWYLKTLLVSQPLHFGDYGGLPLQIIWALLDILTIIVLWSGLVLWWRRHRHPQAAVSGAMPAETATAPVIAREST